MYTIKENDLQDIERWLDVMREHLKSLFVEAESKNALPDSAVIIGKCLGKIGYKVDKMRS